MVKSGLGGRIWFKSDVADCETRIVANKVRIWNYPLEADAFEKGDVSYCIQILHIQMQGYVYISNQKEGLLFRVSILCELSRQSILDSNLTRAHVHFLFQKRIQFNLIKHDSRRQ